MRFHVYVISLIVFVPWRLRGSSLRINKGLTLQDKRTPIDVDNESVRSSESALHFPLQFNLLANLIFIPNQLRQCWIKKNSVLEIYSTFIIRIDVELHPPWWWRQRTSPKRWFLSSTVTQLIARKHFSVLKISIFGCIMPCSPLKLNRRFGGSYRLHLRDRWISPARNQHESRKQTEPTF
jgi:hypothetical protein